MKNIVALGYVAAFTTTLLACGQEARTAHSDTSGRIAQAGNASRCNVQGVWSLDSVIADGQIESRAGRKQMKVISATHYAWMSQEGGVMPLVTTADSLAAYRTRGSGAGTYRVTDSSYIEHIDLFYDPSQIGKEVKITCRVAGNRWDHSFDWPLVENGKPRMLHVQEIWRRVEQQ